MLERRPVSRVSEIVPANEQPEVRPLAASHDGAEFSGDHFLKVVWRRRWIIVGCLAIALASAALYLYRATPIYSSTSQMYIQQNGPRIIGDLQSADTDIANYLLTQCEVITSTAVLSTAIAEPEMQAVKTLQGSDNPIGMLKSCVTAAVSAKSDLITVSAQSTSPEDAAVIVNTVVEAYVEYENKMHRSTAAEVLRILQKEKDREDSDYAATSKQLLEFRQANGMLSFESDKGNIIVLRLGELSQALTTAQLDALQAKLNAETVDTLAEDPQKLEQYILAEGKQQSSGENPIAGKFQDLQQRNDALRFVYGPNYPLMQQIDQQGATLSADMVASQRQATRNYVDVVHQQAQTAQHRVDALQKAFGAQQELALTLNSKAAELSQLESSLSRSEKLLDTIDSRMKEIHATEDDDASISISVLETGKPELLAVRPKSAQVLGMGFVVGLMIGLGVAMLLDWMDHRIRSAAEIDAMLDLPVLGAIPHISGHKSAMKNGQEMHLVPHSDVAEAYRTVRTAITFRIDTQSEHENVKVLLVTSPAPGDGKSTVASNLAIALAQAGRKVLLIDADMRRPMIHKIYDVDSEFGLSTLLGGLSTLEQAIHRTSTEHLDILPCGPLPANPAELLSSPVLQDVLRVVSGRYDQIILDSPPAVPVTDACILASITNLTVLVLRAEKSTTRMSRHARDALLSVGAEILGVVVNDAPRGSDGYGYYYGGRAYYRYGYASNGTRHTNGHTKEIAAITIATPNGKSDE
jgi:capsular exopolysaccharide synthesis family protein